MRAWTLVALALLQAGEVGAQSTVSCSAAFEEGASVRTGGLAELLPPMQVECAGFPPTLDISVPVTVESDVPFLAIRGGQAGPPQPTDAYAWLLDGKPLTEESDQFNLLRNGGNPRLLSTNVAGRAEGGILRFAVTGLRVNLAGIAASTPVVVRVTIGPAETLDLPLAQTLAGPAVEWTTSQIRGAWRLQETGPLVLRKRIETDPDQTGSEELLGRRLAETPLHPGNVHLAATMGTRLATLFPELPEGVFVVGVNCTESEQTAGFRLRRVEGFDPNTFSGGMPTACGGDAELTSAGSMVWEIEGEEGITGAATADAFDALFRVVGPSDYRIEMWAGLGPIDNLAKLNLASLSQPSTEQNVITSLPLFGAENLRLVILTPSGPLEPSPVLNGASFERGRAIAPATVTSIFGASFSDQTVLASAVPLPTELGGVRVLVNGTPAPLYFVSPTQVNFQAPLETGTLGSAAVVVEVGGQPRAPVEVGAAEVSPAIFTLPLVSGARGAVAFDAAGQVAQPAGWVQGLSTRPIRRGDVLVFYAAGLGPTARELVIGDDSLDDDGSFVRRDVFNPLTVRIGGVELPGANVPFKGLSPQFVGVYQINAVLPENAPTGDAVELTVEVAGEVSQPGVTIAVD